MAMKKMLKCTVLLMMLFMFGSSVTQAASVVYPPCNRTTTLTYGWAYTRCSAGSYSVGAKDASSNHYASCNFMSNGITTAAANSYSASWVYDSYSPGVDVNHTHRAASALQTRSAEQKSEARRDFISSSGFFSLIRGRLIRAKFYEENYTASVIRTYGIDGNVKLF